MERSGNGLRDWAMSSIPSVRWEGACLVATASWRCVGKQSPLKLLSIPFLPMLAERHVPLSDVRSRNPESYPNPQPPSTKCQITSALSTPGFPRQSGIPAPGRMHRILRGTWDIRGTSAGHPW